MNDQQNRFWLAKYLEDERGRKTGRSVVLQVIENDLEDFKIIDDEGKLTIRMMEETL